MFSNCARRRGNLKSGILRKTGFKEERRQFLYNIRAEIEREQRTIMFDMLTTAMEIVNTKLINFLFLGSSLEAEL